MLLGRRMLLLGGSGRRLSTATGAGGAAAAAGGHLEEKLGAIPLAFPAVCMWGSNTGVGKTLFSAGLAAACRRAGLSVLYLKPAQTGFPADSDARLVAAAARLPLAAGPHAAHLLTGSSAADEAHAGSTAQLGSSSSCSGGSSGSGNSHLAKVLYAWSRPVSPHLAVEMEGRPVSDRQLAAAVAAELRGFAAAGLQSGSSGSGGSIAIVETAGGVASPGPSGTLQCDLLRPLHLPGILVGDGRLGGISATLSAYDSLVLRGHSVPLVVLMDGSTSGSGQAGANSAAIQRHLRGKAAVLSFPVCEPPLAGQLGGQQGAIDASLAAWLEDSAPQFDRLVQLAAEAHQARLAQLGAAAGDARRMLWWPFTQHASVAGDAGVTVIDSRVGECFSVYRPPAAKAQSASSSSGSSGGRSSGSSNGSSAAGPGGSLELLYDACASWWTQGVSQEAQPELVRAMSAAAARFGHVMFPENAHEPAVELARELLSTVGAGWAGRVFYTDDGSTAVEVALKMAFRKFMVDHGLLDEGGTELEVLGLTEGYHGDTLGAMDAVSPSPFNGRMQTPWYTGRGLFLEPPTVVLQQGAWRVSLPPDMVAATEEAAALAAAVLPGARQKPFATQCGSREAVFALEQRMQAAGGEGAAQVAGETAATASLYPFYLRYIQQQLDDYEAAQQQRLEASGSSSTSDATAGEAQQQQQQRRRVLGACIVEPVLQGAGGMRLIDPLYQRALVEVCRERGIPVIFDEVFTGLWRLGAPSGAALLGVSPDIACYAKLLTGGMVPLSATLATDSVFQAFEGDTKAQALLHGHSYTAHPIGCAAGVASLQLYRDAALNPNWCTPEAAGRCQRQRQGASSSSDEDAAPAGGCCDGPCGRLLPLWDEGAVAALSRHPSVRSVVTLGTVLAVQLQPLDGTTGYGSNAAAAVVRRLRSKGVFGRPLGDVVYLMVTPMTARTQCDALLGALAASLD